MRIYSKLHGLALSWFVALAACNGPITALDDDGGIIRSVRYDLPIIGWDDEETNPEVTLEIIDGLFMADGKALSRADVSAITAKSKSDGWTRVAVLPNGDENFGDVVTNLETLSLLVGSGFEMSGTEEHRQFGKGAGSGRDANVVRDFRGAVGEHELPVVIDFEMAQDACIVSLAGTVYDSDEFYNRSFYELDSWVIRAGGIDAFIAKHDDFPNVAARIQSDFDTPWRCIAGAIYHIQASGFTKIQLELVSDEH